MTDQETIEKLAGTNSPDYNIIKTCEELAELSEVLLKKLAKRGGPKEPTNDAIIEEIGDVVLRCAILAEVFGEKKVQDRMAYKLDKYREYLEQGLYKGKI